MRLEASKFDGRCGKSKQNGARGYGEICAWRAGRAWRRMCSTTTHVLPASSVLAKPGTLQSTLSHSLAEPSIKREGTVDAHVTVGVTYIQRARFEQSIELRIGSFVVRH